jgi:hypothetical protein
MAGQGMCSLAPDLAALTPDERRHLRQADAWRHPHYRRLVEALFAIMHGYGRIESFARVPEPEGNLVELLVGLGLAIEDGRSLDLADDVAFSLRLDDPSLAEPRH